MLARRSSIGMSQLPPAVRMASVGEFLTYDAGYTTGLTKNTGTTYASLSFGSASSAVLIPKVQMWMWLFSASARIPMVVAVVKVRPGDTTSTMDIDDTVVLTKLRTEGRLFYHHWHYLPCVESTSNIIPRPFMFEYKNVKLDEDEYLQILYRPLVSNADIVHWAVAKYSQTDL
jgi:hypothetical protein